MNATTYTLTTITTAAGSFVELKGTTTTQEDGTFTTIQRFFSTMSEAVAALATLQTEETEATPATETETTEAAPEVNTEIKWEQFYGMTGVWMHRLTPDFFIYMERDGRKYTIHTDEHDAEDMDEVFEEGGYVTTQRECTELAREFAEYWEAVTKENAAAL